ncbi:6774_t:CDS:2 [Cetraspora pellucida]|uniref:6774_t:CDS:1 n=1 Tax=Cetraspora pellucida TaxID=1433469 RepID=A0A9N9HZ40_9GLOM|nr:6774_t:CDS:2 [Cetraspora pellucida]
MNSLQCIGFKKSSIKNLYKTLQREFQMVIKCVLYGKEAHKEKFYLYNKT